MHPVITRCPICADNLTVTQLHCRQCDTSINGHFTIGRFSELSADQLDFVELFVRCEGKINRVCQELNLSYPVVRAQLTDVIESMGYTVGEPEPEGLSATERQAVLAQVAAGEISADDAVKMLRG